MAVDEPRRTVWEDAFDETLRDEQLKEDSDAWRAVTGLLMLIISIGVTLAVFTVLITKS